MFFGEKIFGEQSLKKKESTLKENIESNKISDTIEEKYDSGSKNYDETNVVDIENKLKSEVVFWMGTGLKESIHYMIQNILNVSALSFDIPKNYPELEIIEESEHNIIRKDFPELFHDESKNFYKGYRYRDNTYQFYIIQGDFDESLESARRDRISKGINELGYNFVASVENNISFFLVYNNDLVIHHKRFWVVREMNMDVPLAPSTITEVSIDSNFTVLKVSFELIEEIRKLVITIDDIRVSELESLKKKYEPKTDDNNEE